MSWLELINVPSVKHLLGIRDVEPIVKVTGNSYRVKLDKNLYKEVFFCYDKMTKYLSPLETTLEIANEYKEIEQPQEAIEHYLGYHVMNEKYPLIFLQDATKYSLAGDGSLQKTDPTWATARNATSATTSWGGLTNAPCAQAEAGYYITRGYFPFNTASLGAGVVIIKADFKVFDGGTNADGGGTVALIQTTQASTGSLVAADFDNITLNSPDEGADRFDIGSWGSSGYNTFSLNGTGKGWINKTGNTLLGLRASKDVDNSTPSGSDVVRCYFSEQSGTANDPKLEVYFSHAGLLMNFI